MPGSATEVGGWVLLEHHGPWGRDVFDGVAFDPELSAALEAAVDAAGVRLLLIRPPGRIDPADAGHRLLLAPSSPTHTWLEQTTLDRPADLLDLDLSALRGPAPGIGDPAGGPVTLVCTHGRRDRCCAVDGRPVAAALDAAGLPVWECSHTGGHRFAAVSITVPTGYNYGRLAPDEAVAAARGLADGRVPLEGLRGRSCYDAHGQAAEVAVRRAEAKAGREYGPGAVRVGEAALEPAGEDRAEQVHATAVRVDGGPDYTVRTVIDPLAARPVSCGADPKPVHPVRVLTVTTS